MAAAGAVVAVAAVVVVVVVVVVVGTRRGWMRTGIPWRRRTRSWLAR